MVDTKTLPVIPQVLLNQGNSQSDFASYTQIFLGKVRVLGASLEKKVLCKTWTNHVSVPPHSTRLRQSNQMRLLCGEALSCTKTRSGWDEFHQHSHGFGWQHHSWDQKCLK